MSKILIIIPAFNEEKNIQNVLNSLHSQNPHWHLLVINDGSKDLTSQKAKELPFANVIDLSSNLGIGGGVQTGFKFAKYNDFDVAVQFDGDGQHRADELEKILSPIKNKGAEIVIGSRFKTKTSGFQSTFTRRIGIKIFSIVNSFLIKQRITDNTSGFRAYSRDAFCFLADFYPTDYPEPEAVILLGKNEFRIKEVSVKMLERQGGVSSISGFKSIYYMIKVLLAILMTATRAKVK